MVPPNAPTKKIFLSDRPEEEKKVDPQLAPELTPTAPPPHPVPHSPEEAAAAQEPKGQQPHPPPATTTACNQPSSIALAPHHPTLARLKKTACLRWN